MLRFVLRKLIHKKWMAACLLIGNILLVSIASCNPMYTEAVLQRMLDTRVNDYIADNNRYPGAVTMTGSAQRRDESEERSQRFFETDALAMALPEEVGVPALYQVRHFYADALRLDPDVPRAIKDSRTVSIGFLSDMAEHVTMVAGDLWQKGRGEDGCYDVIISQTAMASLDLLLGETFTSPNAVDETGAPLRLRVAGVFANSSDDDLYWVRTPLAYRGEVFLAEEDFRVLFLSGPNLRFALGGYWYNVLDCAAMRAVNVAAMSEALAEAALPFNGSNNFRYFDYIGGIFSEHLVKAEKVRATLMVLQVPIFVLLAAFIFMVARQMLEMEQAEIAILKSRGAGRGQIIGVYLLQSAVLALAGAAVGLPLGVWLCQVLGSANAFLEFVSRKALDVRVNANALIFTGAAVAVSILTMSLPVLRYAKVSIVNQKQARHRRSETPLWQKFGLDFALLAVSLYGLYSFNSQKAVLAERVADGAGLDPLLFLCSSLFILGAGLVAVRVAPIVAWLIYKLGSRLWSPALYASFLRVLRTRRSQGFIMVFLVMTIALGMFNARAARTVNSNEENRLRYLCGTDIVLRESWDNNADQLGENSTEKLMYDEPDFDRFTTLEGAESVTRVLITNTGAVATTSKSAKNITIMGINTREFGQTIRFQEGLLPEHINVFLNAISQNTHAVLISRNFADYMGLKLGDSFNYRSDLGQSVRAVVYGIVEYWPGYNSLTRSMGADGQYRSTEHYLIVAHLSQLQSAWGVTPYHVWIRARDGDTSFIYDLIREKDLRLTYFIDLSDQLVSLKNDPIFQGTNGILTVGFIVALTLCAVGFLMYWVLSIQSRALQFGIFRAMGMTLREILSMLINEQVFISGVSIATGAVVGVLASRLFIPLIQISYAPVEEVIPLEVVNEASDAARMFGVVGVMILVCMAVLGVLISRIHVSQALKLGED